MMRLNERSVALILKLTKFVWFISIFLVPLKFFIYLYLLKIKFFRIAVKILKCLDSIQLAKILV